MSADRTLVVNADDFGRSPAINRGVIRAHREGIVTSASLMVRYEAAADAAAAARDNPLLSVGLHLDLDSCELDACEPEVLRQLERFRSLMGEDPTHVDSHHHVHRHEPLRSVAAQAADRIGVPLRETGPIRYCGAFYGQGRRGEPLPAAIEPAALASLIRELPAGVTELGCHPSEGVDFQSSYASERPVELRALCDQSVRRAVGEAGVRLCSFRQVI